ncbi:hypothetical protein FIBSPDRAFT_783082 [Athelia psychrophila]|uniref:Cryptic loci regulator 2 N-terminal domain-containing protein n=1 Tax=Athelia psychrophila TaxID=1759441 RepID=A0A166NZE0_9AGAM|nr:hypothetical protein FIBSPDRAFT_783082 [Fibularhizoctonia sp. CBS 109695]
MSHRGASKQHVIPPNPKWVEFESSDGDESLWPTNTTEVVDREGHVNYMRPAVLDEALSIKWRVEVARGVAKLANWDPEPAYVLKTWPTGYQMFDHNKGPRDSPRHDAYLMGSAHTSKFRSVPEFIPHAYWLLLPDDGSRPACQCKYCSKSGGQRAITMSLGLLPARTSSTSAPPQTPSRRIVPPPRMPKSKPEGSKPYAAAIRRVPKPPRATQEPKQVFAPQRNSDLRAAYGKTSAKLKRWFREGEVLWCALAIPINGGKGDEDRILFWPGVVAEIKFKTEPIPRNHSMDDEGDGAGQEVEPALARITAHPSTAHSNRGPMLESSQSSWTVRQWTVYSMRLLAVSHTIDIPDEGVLPYQAYVPPDQLLQAMRDVPYEQLDPRPERMSLFNPSPAPPQDPLALADFLYSYSNGQRFVEAAAPYSIAMQIASGMAGGWSVTDEWAYKLNVEAADIDLARSRAPQYPGSLHEVISASMAHNAAQHDVSESASAGPSSRPVPATAAVRQTVVQKRYQGLWWGTERIWTDDVVRLKVARRQIAPQGAENIYKPAGVSQRSIEYNTEHGFPDPAGPEFDASGRGVFMRIEAIYLADIQRDGKTKGEIRVSGMLYELADVDWEDPEDQSHQKEPLLNGDTEMPAVSGDAALTGGTMAVVGLGGASIEPILANPDPAIPPLASTTRIAEPASPHKPSHNDQLSHPRGSDFYPLPPAPTGFKLRPILPPGHEVVVDLTFISGRYYPCLLAHPLLQSTIDRALRSPVPLAGGPSAHEYLWAMEGLSPGCYNSVDPSYYKKDRVQMLRDADSSARAALEKFWQGLLPQKEGDDEDYNLSKRYGSIHLGEEDEETPAAAKIEELNELMEVDS